MTLSSLNRRMPDEVKVRRVVSNFILHDSDDGTLQILLLKRSDKVRNYAGLWCTVSGSLATDESPRDCAVREIAEETGIQEAQLTLLHEATEMVVDARDRNIAWHVTPFLWLVRTREVTIDWEHTEYAWIDPARLGEYELVPDLEKTYYHLLHDREARHRRHG